MNSWHTYPQIYNLGHRYVADLLKGLVNIEEKVDGSQFSFGIDEEGELHVRSKGATMIPDAPEKMFTKAVQTVKNLAPILHPGWTYRGEFLGKPKHNTLAYNRVPKGNIILFDINDSEESYLSYADKLYEAGRLDLEVVPLLGSGLVTTLEEFRPFLEKESILGGQKVEGVVVKPAFYDLFGQDKKVLMGKFVSEAFKEIHQGEWKKQNPTTGDIIEQIADSLTTPARWNKARQHLKESGLLDNSPRDIGFLMKEVPEDIKKEYEEEIKAKLFAHAWPQIRRKVTHGLAEWYKLELLKDQFDEQLEVQGA